MAPEFKLTRDWARRALGLLQHYHISCTPENYTVWYYYCSDQMPALKRALDILISNEQEFTPDVCAELYERFCSSQKETDRVRLIATQIEGAVVEALGALVKAGVETKNFNQTLGSQAESLDDAGVQVDTVREIVRSVMSETHMAIERSNRLEVELSRSTAEIGALRKQVEDASREALTDALTGIGNRKQFDQRLKHEMQQSMEKGTELSLLLMDIDHFKKFNDTHGHQFGDLVLRLVARALLDGIKGRDIAARYGGEEFVILLPDTAASAAMTVAEHLRESIARKTIQKRDTRETLGTVTISVGVAAYRLGEPSYVFIERADAALYQAKTQGRNCCVMESDDNPPKGMGEAFDDEGDED